MSYKHDDKSYYNGWEMNTRPPLANAELAIMDLLWDRGQMTARQIREALYEGSKSSQHGTVQRLLQRLEDKGYVRRDDALSVHLFSATLTREEYGSSQIESLAEKLTHGSLAPLMSNLIEQNRISADEIARLRAILDEEPEATES